MPKSRVHIVGAGPVGVTAALALCRQNIPVTILEAEGDVCSDLRAAYYHAPSVDMLDDLGFLDPLLEGGTVDPMPRFTDVALGRSVDLDLSVLERKYRHPYSVSAGQNWFTKKGFEVLADHDCEFLFNHRVVSATSGDDDVTMVVDTPQGQKTIRTDWLLGCDGGKSAVRKSAGIEMQGYTWDDRFLLIETTEDLETEFGRLDYRANGPDWRLVIRIPYGPRSDDWRYRVVRGISEEDARNGVNTPEFCQGLLQDLHPRDEPYNISGTTIYNVHQFVAASFREKRIILIGDAAHLNNPIGGLGLNSGIHDAVNFAHKFAMVWENEREEPLLDLYDRQRRLTNWEYIQKVSIENKNRNQEEDLAKREQAMSMLEQVSRDEEKLFQFLNRWSMGESLDYEQTIN